MIPPIVRHLGGFVTRIGNVVVAPGILGGLVQGEPRPTPGWRRVSATLRFPSGWKNPRRKHGAVGTRSKNPRRKHGAVATGWKNPRHKFGAWLPAI